MKFLGTSAGEGIPDPFCTCPICENARRVGGKELRTRSSFLLDEETIIDLGADYFAQARDHGLRLDKLRTVLLTHTHDDHFNYTFFWERSVKRAGTGEPLTVILSEEGKRYFDEFYVRSPALGSERLLSPPNAVLRAVKPGGREHRCAHVSGTLYAGYPHLYFPSCPRAAERFIQKCLERKQAT